MITFNRDKNILTEEETDLLHDILNEKKENDYDNQIIISNCLSKLEKKGFKV